MGDGGGGAIPDHGETWPAIAGGHLGKVAHPFILAFQPSPPPLPSPLPRRAMPELPGMMLASTVMIGET